MTLRQLTNQEFKNFINNFYLKSIYQTPNYASVMQNENYNCIYLGLENNSIIIAATLIIIKKESGFKYAYAPRGFLINYEDFYLFKEFTKLLKEYLSKTNIIAIKLNPIIIKGIYDFNTHTSIYNEKYSLIMDSIKHNNYHHLGYNNFFEALKPRFEASIDLTADLQTIFKNIKKEYRTKIRSSIKNGVEIYKGDANNIDYLYEFTKVKYPRKIKYLVNSYNSFNNDNMIEYFYTKINTKKYLKEIQKTLIHYETKSNDLNNKMIKRSKDTPRNLIDKKISADKYLNKYKNELINSTKLLRNFPDGIITSAILIVKHGYEVYILIDGFDKNYSRFNSKHLLIWELIQIYKKQGFKTFNLGGVSNIAVDTNKYVGLNNFKINFGAKVVEYAGDFELTISKHGYNLYRNYVPLKNLIKSKLIKDDKKS